MVEDEERRNVTYPHEFRDYLERKHFLAHFHNETASVVEADTKRPLNRPIDQLAKKKFLKP